jgi:hypothetical protein
MVITKGHGSDAPMEFVTRIRGREVSCWLSGDALHGDEELLKRMRRLDPMGRCRDSASIARLVRDAVGSEVTLRALGATRASSPPTPAVA